MKCPNCGNQNPEDAQFCYRCGTPLPSEGGAQAEDSVWLARLERFMPGELLDKIRSQGRIEGERRPVTVLFADLSGFTALGDALDAEALKNLTNECLEVLVRSVFKYEGFVDKFIGDAVMALFGAPIAHEDDPERALRAALDMLGGLDAVALALPEGAGSPSLHAGIHTGDVVMGEVGTDLRLSYTAVGDAVNVASRLQDLAQPREILVSEATYRLTRTLFRFRELEARAVKGKKVPVQFYRLEATKPGARAPRGVPGLQASLVGREPEYEALAAAIRSTLQGLGQIATLTGEPGIGKSRLVLEARNEFGEDAIWLEGRCLSYGGSIAFWPFAEVVKQWAGIEEEDPEAAMAAKMRLALRGLVPDRVDDFLPYLGTLLALRLDERDAERVKYLGGEDLQRRIFLSLRDWLEALAQKKPVVLVLEDLHWADPSSVALLDYLLEATDRSPLLLLLVARAEREQPWWQAKLRAETEFPHRYKEIALRPLSQGASETLVSELLAIPDFPGQIREVILEKAEGNPFFVEEVIRGMIDGGVLVREDGHWTATTGVFEFEIPDTLQGVILARIDRLEAETRQVLQRAAVIGRAFLFRVLAAVTDIEAQLDRELAALQRVDLIQERTRLPELEYVFKHALTQDVTYSTLLEERRKEFHQRVGEAIERLFPDRLPEFYPLLAHHYSRAEHPEKALDYLVKAAERSKATFANAEAIEFYGRALALVDRRANPELAADLLDPLADVQLEIGEESTARDTREELVELCESLADGSRLAMARFRLADLLRRAGEVEEAGALVESGISLIEGKKDALSELAEGHLQLAEVRFARHELAESRMAAERAAELWEQSANLAGVARAALQAGRMSWLLGDVPSLMDWSKLARRSARQAGRPDLESEAIFFEAGALADRGDLKSAEASIRHGIALAEKSGYVMPLLRQYQALGNLLWMAGRWAEAREQMDRHIELAQRTGYLAWQADAY